MVSLLLFEGVFFVQSFAYEAGEVVYAHVDRLRVRDRAGFEGEVVGQVYELWAMVFTGEASDFRSEVTLRDVRYHEPWLKVRCGDLEGWVFGGGVSNDPKVLGSNVFGEGEIRLIEECRRKFGGRFGHSAEVKELFDYVQEEIRPQLNEAVLRYYANWVKVHPNIVRKPSFDWFEGYVSGLRVGNLDRDYDDVMALAYKDFETLAKQSIEKDDDDFVAFHCLQYPDGCVETEFYYWLDAPRDQAVQSLLGSGRHLAVLKQLYVNRENSSLFRPYYDGLHGYVIDDICYTHESDMGSFRYSKAKCLEEVEQILRLSGLSSSDRSCIEGAIDAWE